MKEEQYIASLFEAARKEPPKIPLEQVSDTFVASSAAHSGLFYEITRFFNLNTIVMISLGTCALILWALLSSPENPKPAYSETPTQPEIAPSESEQTSETIVSEEEIIEIRQIKAQGQLQVLRPFFIRELSLLEQPSAPMAQLPENKLLNQLEYLNPLSLSNQKIKPLANSSNALAQQVFQPLSRTTRVEDKDLTLHRTDTDRDVIRFKEALEKYNFQAKVDAKFKDNGIKKVITQLGHPNGLDMIMKITGFEAFTIKLDVDENGQAKAISYKTERNKAYSNPILLHKKGKSKVKVRSSHSDSAPNPKPGTH